MIIMKTRSGYLIEPETPEERVKLDLMVGDMVKNGDGRTPEAVRLSLGARASIPDNIPRRRGLSDPRP
jgi:hypothetical protein